MWIPLEEVLDVDPEPGGEEPAVLDVELNPGLGGPEFNLRRAAEPAASRGVEAL